MRLPFGYEWFPGAEVALPWNENPSNSRATVGLVLATAAALALPPVHRALGIDPVIACALVLSYALSSVVLARLLPWFERDPRRVRAKILIELLHGVAVVDGLAVATHDPATSLWALTVMYAAFDGADYDLPPLVTFLGAHVAGPLATVPFFLAMGHPAATAVGIPVFVALMTFVAFQYGAARKIVVRGGFVERDALAERLVAERAAHERERVHRQLSASIAERLREAARSGEADERVADAARESLGELRQVMEWLAPREPGRREPPRAHRPALDAYLPWLRADAADRWNWTRGNLLQAAALSSLLAAALAIPAIASALGVHRAIAVPLVLLFPAWMLVFAALVDVVRRRERRRVIAVSISIGLGNLIACGLSAASGDPDTPLWTAPVMYAAFNGSDHELHASYSVLAIHVLTPLATIPIFLALGAPPAAAVGGPVFFALVCFMSYHYGAVRSRVVREARAERERLRAELDDERQSRERERLARDLHDGVASSLSLVAVYGDLAGTSGDDRARAQLRAALSDATQQGLAELEALLEGLSGTEDRSLAHLLRARLAPLGEAVGASVEVQVSGDGQARLGPAARYALLRIAQEGVANALRHGEPARVVVELATSARDAVLRVSDDGSGFDARTASRGRGLANMRRRAEELGGAFRFESDSRGTRLSARVPLSEPPARRASGS